VVEVATKESPRFANGGAEANTWVGLPDLGGASTPTEEGTPAGQVSLKMFSAVVSDPALATTAGLPGARCHRSWARVSDLVVLHIL
jgi:hypothetical protein